MAASTAPLIWDFYRDVGVGSPGGLVHYFDEDSQSLYLNTGIKTKTAKVPNGHWKTAVPGAAASVSAIAYSDLRLDHAANGTLYGVAIDGTGLYLLRYLYAMDISDFTKAGSWTAKTDNPIAQLSLSLGNVGAEVFASDKTLFNPGARLSLAVALGDSEPYDIGVAFLDEANFDAYSPTVPLSGRNATGYKLAGQTFDETTGITGTADVVAAKILELGGVTEHRLQAGDHTWTHIFKPEQTLLSGLQQLMEFYIGWQMREAPDGSIIMGYPAWIKLYLPNTAYTFDGGREVVKRKTDKSSDAAYSRVRITGRDGAGAELNPVYAAVKNWAYWQLGEHKTKHIRAPDGFTQAQLASYATQMAEDLQYVGIGEQFTSPIRPQLLVGDVASIFYGAEAPSDLGLITDVAHRFGEAGFWTDFSVDSGGVATDGSGYIITRNAALQGYNRRQTLADLIGVISRK
ncbi:MAG: hypothetical protein RR235_07910 [Oscillospiraceae bacterium]